jgi:hypothetical protein
MKLVALLLVACGSGTSDDCTCKPTHAPSEQGLELLRRHRAAPKNGRDTKLIDDEARVQAANLCSPCNTWVGERARIDELYPLERLDDATAATCMGLVLRDGSTAFGASRVCK